MPNTRFSAVQLTLLSVIVALILESLLNQIGDSNLNWTSAQLWLQAALIALTVIAIWSGYALILTTSERPPETVDFVYPFGLLITLTLASNSLEAAHLARYFLCMGLGGVFACWALWAEAANLEGTGQSFGVKRALYIQAADTILNALLATVLYLATLPAAAVIIGLLVAIAIQLFAAWGTMAGWRYVSRIAEDASPEPD